VAQKNNIDARAGREPRHPILPSAICAILAVGAAVGAFSASGIPQVILIVLAVLLTAYTPILFFAGLVHSVMTGFNSRSSRGSRARVQRDVHGIDAG
jgi:hypothetical protein